MLLGNHSSPRPSAGDILKGDRALVGREKLIPGSRDRCVVALRAEDGVRLQTMEPVADQIHGPKRKGLGRIYMRSEDRTPSLLDLKRKIF